jgi:cobalt-zinc-cadmium efflux system outer membrane protein
MKQDRLYHSCITLLVLASARPLFGQSAATNRPSAALTSWIVTNSVPATNEITFVEFLNEVAEKNLDYAAQRYNVDIAKADIAIAKEFPNPNLNLNGGKDVRNWYRKLPDASGRLVSQTMPEPVGIGIDQTIEYYGKRKWRVRVADQAHRAAADTLEDFLRNLKLDASAAFVEALAAQRALEQQREAAGYLSQLVAAQRLRFEAGDIGETDLTQSRVDELQAQSDLLNAKNDAQRAQLALSTFLGRNRGQTTFQLRGKLEQKPRTFDPAQLVTRALESRADLIALRHARDTANSGIHLAKANRGPDVDVGLGFSYTSGSQNLVAPSEPDSSLALSLTFPLPIWNRQRAEIQTAKFLAEQAEKTLESAELKAEVQVRQTFATFQLMGERVGKFESGLLKGADDVLAAKRFSYEHGQTTLLDLLNAQRDDNQIHQSYNDALADAAKALIELDRAAGLWDIAF